MSNATAFLLRGVCWWINKCEKARDHQVVTVVVVNIYVFHIYIYTYVKLLIIYMGVDIEEVCM